MKAEVMKICVDVFYYGNHAIAGAVTFQSWSDQQPLHEVIHVESECEDYVPGQFYKRELPAIRHLLGKVAPPIECIIIDGYVWLNDAQSPGLGAHLYAAMGQKVGVIGVAKNRYRNSTCAAELQRGDSKRPLFVTAAGIDVADAANYIREMHGDYRLPTLLKHADRLGRDYAAQHFQAKTD